MKKIFTLCIMTTLLFALKAQTNSSHAIEKNLPAEGIHKMTQLPGKNINPAGTLRGASTPFYLWYANVDGYNAVNSGGTSYYETFQNVNKRYPNSADGTWQWAAVLFDTLIEVSGSSIITDPLSTSTLSLDSVSIFFIHDDAINAKDTITVTVFDLDSFQFVGTPGPTETVSYNKKWDTVLTTKSTIPLNFDYNQDGTPDFTGLTFYPGLSFAQGKTFGVRVDFAGDTGSHFAIINSYADLCGGACVAANSSVGFNSVGYENYQVGVNNYSGPNYPYSLYYDCNQNGQYDSTLCENNDLQNWWILASVSATENTTISPPTVVTTAATNVASTSATINGTVNANGNLSLTTFDWGLTNSYGTSASGNPPSVSGSTTTAVNYGLTGLIPGTTYHYRIDADNSGGTTNGLDRTFTTLSGDSGVCTPDPNVTVGFSPTPDLVPCISQGEYFSQTYTFVVPSTIIFETSTIHIISVTLDNIANLPQSLSWGASATPATYAGGAKGCVNVYGTTNAACGQYLLAITADVNTEELGTLPNLNLAAAGFPNQYLRVISAGNGCPTLDTSSHSAFVSYPTCGTQAVVGANISSSTNVGCYGQSTGSATVTATGGSNYVYTWSNGGTGASVSNLTAGTYYVTVTANGESATASVTITQPGSSVSVQATTTPTSCSSNSGTASATASGGTPGYSYFWSNNQSGSSIHNLAAGTYTVVATDNKGCTALDIVTVSSSAEYTISVTSTPASCYGQNSGQASVTTQGATGNISYNWSNGSTSSTASNLSAGTVTVTVTDGSGCEQVGSVIVTQPSNPLSANTTATESTCSTSTGSATVTVTGNNGAITYAWNNGSTSNTISNLPAGLYSVTVTAGGCTASSSVAVNNSNGPSITLTKTDPTCYNYTNGTISAQVTGGAPAYQYGWSTVGSGPNLDNQGAGTYTLVVTDANQCQATEAITLIQPDSITFNNTINNVTCNGSQNGSILLQAQGGTQPFGYAWSNNGTASTIGNLSGGIYSVTVTDAKNCTAIDQFTVLEPTALQLSVTPTPSSNGTNGAASVSATGGTQPYSYYWSNSETTVSISNLSPATYYVTVSDKNGCHTSDSTSITTGIGIVTNYISSISLFPNPANELLTIAIQMDRMHKVQLQITDVTGKVVYSQLQTVNGTLNQQLNLSDYPSGVYILEAIADQQSVKKRFVVTH